jgi:hypothetical protein
MSDPSIGQAVWCWWPTIPQGDGPLREHCASRPHEPFYELISAFKRADSVSRAAAFEALNRHVAKALPQWRMYTIIRVVLEVAGVSLDEVALINLVPYRIAGNISPSAKVVKAAWAECTAPALDALQPGMVAALGSAPGRALAARSVAPLYVFPRTIGDTYVHPKAYEAARLLAAARGAPTPAGDAARKPQASVATSRARSRATAQRRDIETARFRLGPKTPSPKSVHGIIRAVVARRSGLSGAELLAQLRATDFSATVSPHTANGTPEDAGSSGIFGAVCGAASSKRFRLREPASAPLRLVGGHRIDHPPHASTRGQGIFHPITPNRSSKRGVRKLSSLRPRSGRGPLRALIGAHAEREGST